MLIKGESKPRDLTQRRKQARWSYSKEKASHVILFKGESKPGDPNHREKLVDPMAHPTYANSQPPCAWRDGCMARCKEDACMASKQREPMRHVPCCGFRSGGMGTTRTQQRSAAPRAARGLQAPRHAMCGRGVAGRRAAMGAGTRSAGEWGAEVLGGMGTD